MSEGAEEVVPPTKPAKTKKMVKRIIKKTILPEQSTQIATLERDEANCKHAYGLALKMQAQGDHDQAISIYSELLNRKPVQEAIVDEDWMEVPKNYDQSEGSEVEILKRKSIQVQKDTFLYLKYLSLKNMSTIYKGREALNCSLLASKIDATDAGLLYRIGRLSFELSEWLICRKSLERCLMFSANHPLAWDLLMNLLFVTGDIGCCIWVGKKILSRCEDDSHAISILKQCEQIDRNASESPLTHLEPQLSEWRRTLIKDQKSETVEQQDVEVTLEESSMSWFSYIKALSDVKVKFPNDHIRIIIHRDEDVVMTENESTEQSSMPFDMNMIPSSQDDVDMSSNQTPQEPTQLSDEEKAQPENQDNKVQNDVQESRTEQGNAQEKSSANVRRKKFITNPQKRTTRSNTEVAQKKGKQLSNDLVQLLVLEDNDDDDMNDESNSDEYVASKALGKQKIEDSLNAFDETLETFLQPLITTTTPYSRLIRMSLEHFLNHDPQSWSANPMELATYLINDQEKFSATQTLIIAELFYYLFEDNPTENAECFLKSRRLINKLNIIGINKHFEGNQSYDLTVKQVIRLNYIVGLIAHRSRELHTAHMRFLHCQELMTLHDVSCISVANLIKKTEITEKSVQDKIRELTLSDQLDEIARLVSEKEKQYNAALKRFTPHFLGSLHDDVLKTRARQLLFTCVLKVQDPLESLTSLSHISTMCTFIINGITEKVTREKPENVFNILKCLCLKTKNITTHKSSHLARALLQLIDTLDTCHSSELDCSGLAACVAWLVYRFAKFSDQQKKDNFLAATRHIYVNRFKAKKRIIWFFDYLLDELHASMKRLEESQDFINSDQPENKHYLNIRREMFRVLFLLHGDMLTRNVKCIDYKEVKSFFTDDPQPMVKNQKHSKYAFDLVHDVVKDVLAARGNATTRKEMETVLNVIFNAFNKLPKEAENYRKRLQHIIDDHSHHHHHHDDHDDDRSIHDQHSHEECNRFLDDKPIKLPDRNPLENNPYKTIYEQIHYLLGELYLRNTQIGLDKSIALCASDNSKEFANSVYMLEKAVACTPNDPHAWSSLASRYRILCESLRDALDLTEYTHTVLHDAETRDLLRLKSCREESDHDMSVYKNDLFILTKRCLMCYKITLQLCYSESVCKELICVIYGMFVTMRHDPDVYPNVNKMALKDKLTQFVNSQPDHLYLYPMLMGHVEQMCNSPHEAYMSLFLKSSRLLLTNFSTQAVDIGPLYHLLSSRVDVLLCPKKSPQDLRRVMSEWIVSVPVVPITHNTYCDHVPASVDQIALCGDVMNTNYLLLPTWQNVLQNLIDLLKISPHDHKILYQISRALALGPWNDWKSASTAMKAIFKQKKSTTNKVDTFEFKMWIDKCEIMFEHHQGGYRRWKEKCTLWFADVLKNTRDLTEWSILCSGFRRNRLSEDPTLSDAYVHCLKLYAQVVCQSSTSADWERHLGEVYVYLCDAVVGVDEEIVQCKEAVWLLIKDFGIDAESEQKRVTKIIDYVFTKYEVDLSKSSNRRKKKDPSVDQPQGQQAPSSDEPPKKKRKKIDKSAIPPPVKNDVEVSSAVETKSPVNPPQIVFVQQNFFPQHNNSPLQTNVASPQQTQVAIQRYLKNQQQNCLDLFLTSLNTTGSRVKQTNPEEVIDISDEDAPINLNK
ncbi:calcineurin-binding protein [Acrasis kona]|uniref:Calcineurin-binding protein n=1 Tax=Acrasis kona TaxID=1008807 RepID=A0AAW2ZGL9_9EUKA